MRPRLAHALLAAAALASASAARAQPATPHNVVIFVADGLRSGMVTPETAPTMAALRAQGVDLHNSHSVYPSLTTPNASAIATGHWPGDTGDFGNVLYIGAATSASTPSPFAAVEDDEVLGGLNTRYNQNYLNETSLMAAARKAGYATAAIGKLGPIGIQDVTARDGTGTVVIDDLTGYPGGFPLRPDILAAFKGAGVAPMAEDRGLNGSPGNDEGGGVWTANVQQQDWMTDAATKVLLPYFKARAKPFFMVFWSRDPDGTQHFQGDSLNTLTPGINGQTSLAAIRNADNDLARLREALHVLGLEPTTDIVVLADHGFSVTSKQSATSASARFDYPDVPHGFLPPGFLGVDLAVALKLPLADAGRLPVDYRQGQHPRYDGAIVGADPNAPEVAVAANGGSDLIYLPGADAQAMARRVVDVLTHEDYTGAIFVNDKLGDIPGALPMSAVNLKGRALTPEPAIMVSFKSFGTGCAEIEVCTAEVADTSLQQGQGMHGSFSRADTHNFMALAGPDFRQGYRDPAPASNADVAPTLAHVLGLDWPHIGKLRGRVLSEALPGGVDVAAAPKVTRSAPAADGFVTVLDEQDAGPERYFDAAGMPGRVVGLK